MTGKKDEGYESVRLLGVVTFIPMLLLIGPVVGFFMGGWLDRKFQCYPWLTTIFVILGFTASGREVFRLLKQVSKDSSKTK